MPTTPTGNINTLLQDYNLLSGMNVNGNRFKRIVYDYDLISGKVNQISYQPPVQTVVNGTVVELPNPDAFYHRYAYDAENRITDVETSRDNLLWTRDAKYSYYRHGPLAQLLLGRLRIQELNYSYTVQGWMKGTNLFGNTKNDMTIARNTYSSALGYFDGDYKAINGTAPQSANLVNLLGSNAVGLYNGNIAAQAINIPKLGNLLVYGYQYDQLNRLVGLDAYQAADDNYNGLAALNDYKERLAYDPNGNILSYLRNGTGSSLNLNNYQYRYNNQLSQNQLTNIFNSVNGTTYSYAYDQIGNVTKDDKQGVANAVWNVYGKLQTITKSDGTTINYTYGPNLQRISKKVGWVSEFYVRDATGNMMATYKKDPGNNNGDLTLTKTYKYGSSVLSINTQQINVEHPATNAVTTFMAGNDGYQVTDQNGNTRLVLSDKRTQHSSDGVDVDWYEAIVNTANHFSAFGAISKTVGNISVLGFNGQRKSPEIGFAAQTAEFWEYDGDAGRRWNVDPKGKASSSVYSAFVNNPLFYEDVFGDTAIIRGLKNNGEIRFVNNNWINSRTKEVVNGKDVDKNTRLLMEDYPKLNQIPEISEVINNVNTTSINVVISHTKGKTETLAGPFVKGESGNDLGITINLKKTDIPAQENEGYKKVTLPSYIILGHELGHANDAINKKDHAFFVTNIASTSFSADIYVAPSEINANYWENILRNKAGLPLRTQYGSSNDNRYIFHDNLTIKYNDIQIGKFSNGRPITKVVSKTIFDKDGHSLTIPVETKH